MGFSKATLALLHRAGWWEDPEQDSQQIRDYFTEREYPVYPAVVDYFSRFGGLEIEEDILHIPTVLDCAGQEPVKAAVHDYLGVLVFNAGTAEAGRYSGLRLYISEQGTMYGDGLNTAYDLGTFFIGNTATEAIDALCLGRVLTEPNLSGDNAEQKRSRCDWVS